MVFETVNLLWVKRDHIKMSQEYRDIRSRYSDPMDSCFWCGHKFKEGESMALASVENCGNRIICHACIPEGAKNAEDVL